MTDPVWKLGYGSGAALGTKLCCNAGYAANAE
jgi:hypothetical protein